MHPFLGPGILLDQIVLYSTHLATFWQTPSHGTVNDPTRGDDTVTGAGTETGPSVGAETGALNRTKNGRRKSSWRGCLTRWSKKRKRKRASAVSPTEAVMEKSGIGSYDRVVVGGADDSTARAAMNVHLEQVGAPSIGNGMAADVIYPIRRDISNEIQFLVGNPGVCRLGKGR